MPTLSPRQEIELIVDDLLLTNQVYGPQIPVEALARTKGLPIVEKSMNSDVSGALVTIGPRMQGIAVNSSHAPVRKRFTVAHELGHFLLGHVSEDDHLDWGFTVIRRDGRSSEANDNKEMEANFFAASLLMPRSMLRSDVETKRGFHGEVEIGEAELMRLSRRYGVSRMAMQYRLMNLGLMSFVEE